jgi:Ca2+-binding EF-hand superfamily protein
VGTVRETFNKFDKDHDGYLSYKEVLDLVRTTYKARAKKEQILNEEFYTTAADNLIIKASSSDDYGISWDNFLKFYSRE